MIQRAVDDGAKVSALLALDVLCCSASDHVLKEEAVVLELLVADGVGVKVDLVGDVKEEGTRVFRGLHADLPGVDGVRRLHQFADVVAEADDDGLV